MRRRRRKVDDWLPREWPPEFFDEMERVARRRMESFDQLPKYLRDHVNEHGMGNMGAAKAPPELPPPVEGRLYRRKRT